MVSDYRATGSVCSTVCSCLCSLRLYRFLPTIEGNGGERATEFAGAMFAKPTQAVAAAGPIPAAALVVASRRRRSSEGLSAALPRRRYAGHGLATLAKKLHLQGDRGIPSARSRRVRIRRRSPEKAR